MVAQCEESRRRLRTDYIDLYWMHAWDMTTPVEETMRALDTLVEMLARTQQQELPFATWISGASPRVNLNRSWEEFHQTLPAKHRSNLRNRYKRFEQLAPWELHLESAADQLEDGLRLEAAAWKGGAGTAILADPAVSRFYRLFAERAAERGWLRLNFLRSAGRPAAFDGPGKGAGTEVFTRVR